MAENSQTIEMAERLLAKTQQERVPWEESYEPDSFVAVLPQGLNFLIERQDDWYHLTMKDGHNRELFSLSESFGRRTSEESQRVYDVLSSLYEAARWQALHIVERLGEAKAALEKL